MSLTLILMRHAKSDWGDVALPDKARRLNARGERDAPRIGAWLAARGYIPGSASISAAARTRQTWDLVSEAFDGQTRAQFADDLYHAEADTILRFIRAGSADVHMIVGHNPGIAEAAARIVSQPPAHPRFTDYPTAATLVVALEEAAWRDADWGGARVLDFVTPHDL